MAACSQEKYLCILTAGSEQSIVFHMGDTKALAFASLLALFLNSIMSVKNFERELENASGTEASTVDCIPGELGCRHVWCNVSRFSLKRAYAIVHLNLPDIVQHGLKHVH